MNAKMAIWTVTAKSLGSSVEATKPSRHRISTARKAFAKNGALVAKRRQIDPRSSLDILPYFEIITEHNNPVPRSLSTTDRPPITDQRALHH